MHDGALITASLGAPERFGELFDRHAAAVQRYAVARVGDAAAEDLVADVFLTAFEGRARFDTGRASARPWLLGIATNLIRHHWRDAARGTDALRRLPLEEADDPSARATDRVDAEREVAALAAALRRLRADDLETLLLYAWGDLDYEQIAEATGVPVGTVRSRLNRARRQVRGASGREVRGGSPGIAAAGG